MDEQKIEVGALVELRPGREDVYQRAIAQSRGIVRATRDDEFGFPQLYIAWDKDHWRYNGEEDGWTFADHFTLVRQPNDNELVGAEPYETPVGVDSNMAEHEEQISGYIDQIGAAFNKASEAEGFFLITMRREVDPNEGSMILVDIIKGAIDEELDALPEAELFRFVEAEMRRREQR